MMKPRVFAFVAALMSLVLPSCFQSETVITLHKDGSGTLTEQTLLGAQALQMMEQFSSMGGKEGQAADPAADLHNPEKAKVRAAELGEGVTVEKTEAVAKDGSKGGRTTYHFADINKLRLRLGDAMSQKMPGQQKQAPKGEPVSFRYAGGELQVHMPKTDAAAAQDRPVAPAGGAEQDEQFEMAKEMFADMKLSLRIVCDGGIAETTASNVEGNEVTLMLFDFSKLVKNEAKLKELMRSQPQSPEDMQKVLKGVDGMRFETKPDVTVKLK